ncbi:hypothetical protein L916_05198 [Phytophthora nicotianae]|uniref:Transmembrane protein n=1 Tax=Phytophthora nicotianae TaxID=4792 RepID=W2JDH0_PHYNI|nr:hypothetical protein L916_05198 [Phytophthora nicotianae]
MALNRSYYCRNAPRWMPLLLDIILVVLSLLLDVRDLWFKLRWVGPHNTFSFSTVDMKILPASNAAPLQPTTSFSYANQKLQRDSGWSSFLERCESLTPLLEEDKTRSFRHAVGKNCLIGESTNPIRATDIVLTSSIRVDSVAWAACELLYKHRKPPICHSPIVTQFQERYNFQDKLATDSLISESAGELPKGTIREIYAAAPGRDTETELIELLELISQSSPISATVCVEGFIVKGSGAYSTSIYGCGSPSFYRSVLIGSAAPMISHFLRDKAWLTSDNLEFMGMTFLIRENHRSMFTMHDSTKGNGKRVLEHRSLLNVSASGSLYIIMVLVDLGLLGFSICSVVEISRYMLWALWKPLVASEYQTSSARTTKLGYGVEDYTRVLQIGLLWSTPIALLTCISRLLTWMLVIPSVHLWSDGIIGGGGTHALLTMIRFYDLVILCVNIIWNIFVAFDEKGALAFVRHTYVSPLEVMAISATVAVISVHLGGLQIYGLMRDQDRQRLSDRSSFGNATAIANAFVVHQNTTVAPFDVYYPLLVTIAIGALAVGVFTVLRFHLASSMPPRSLVRGSACAVQPSTAESSLSATSSSIPKGLTRSSAGILKQPVSSSSLTREELTGSGSLPTSVEATHLDEISEDRLPVENMIDNPIRACSLVRRSWALEKLSDGQLLLLPASYLKYGIVLLGKSMKTRCGFMDTVQPLVHSHEHEKLNELENEPHQIIARNASKLNLR